MTTVIRRLNNFEFVRWAPYFVDLYIEAMGYQENIRDSRLSAWRQHSQLPGFTAVAAIEDAEIVGIAYGHSGGPMNWWHLQIQRGLFTEGNYGPRERRILANYFELSEIHVSPRKQGRGIGKLLLLGLVERNRHPQVLLSTPEVEDESNAAFRLYRRLGFTDLLRNYVFAGDHRPFAILKAPLPLNPTEMRESKTLTNGIVSKINSPSGGHAKPM